MPGVWTHGGYLNVEGDHWFVCDVHRTKWFAGTNLFSSWRDEGEAQWEWNAKHLETYREVEPYFNVDAEGRFLATHVRRDGHRKPSRRTPHNSFTVPSLAKRLGCSSSYLYRLCRQHGLARLLLGTRSGGSRYILPEETQDALCDLLGRKPAELSWASSKLSAPPKDRLSVAAVASRLGVSRDRVLQRIKRGHLKAVQERAGRWFITEPAVREFGERAQSDPSYRLRRYPTRRRKKQAANANMSSFREPGASVPPARS